jgi:signal transduction histidine kinase/CheY-like chemotaxis protein
MLDLMHEMPHNAVMKSFHIDGITAAGRARLLEMISQPRSGELSLLIIPPTVTAYHASSQGLTALLLWPIAALVLALALHRTRALSTRYRTVHGDARWFERWVPASLRMVTAYGFIWAMPVLILSVQALWTQQPVLLDFSLLLYAMLASIVAICTNSLTSLFQFFQRVFIGSWVLPTLCIPLMFPQHWLVLMPLCVLYGWIAFQHARKTHGFLINQVQLEERSTQLAQQYQAAKVQAEAAQQAAERALQDKSEFLRTASHDLRQPVHAMGLLVETLARESHETQLKPLLRDLQSSLRSVNLMFNSLLDLSKLEVADQPIKPEPVRLQGLMDELSALFKPEADRRGLTWRVKMPSERVWGEVWARADAALLRQAVFNLTHNALRYTSAGGVLVGVRARRVGGVAHWQIEVCDTGAGIAQHEQGEVYSPYYRSEHSWQIDSIGMGLGLAVFRQCVQRMGATDGMRSVLGRGSRFWISLPQTRALGTSTTPLRVNPALSAYVQTPLRGRCLVLDDDPLVRSAWQALLHSWGLQAQLVADAAEAMAVVEAGFDPQVIFCDQRLRSGESGFDVLQALLERCPEAKGGMISGEFEAPELREAQEQGYTVLRKPTEAAVLHAVLARWLGTPAAAEPHQLSISL